ncbi:Glycosyltransferase involved in cell wall bisynthesis [Salegentibacter salinarum]|nr:glycosyltransferase family A protein [Salegentibacter salinarum]SKB76358.1 Glycosyltransferase involved in cell wall bisynthesis [Salegentibacter salinarum]
MKPLVSIIIPTYNRAHLIGETLDSVIAQTYKNWECIVVDDHSTDNTSQVGLEYTIKDERITFVKRPKGSLKGAASCRNIGLKNAKGDFVQFLDSDDLLAPDKLEVQFKYARKEILLTGKWGYFSSRDHLERFKYKQRSYRNFKAPLKLLSCFGKNDEFFPLHTYLIPMEVIKKAGKWREDLGNNDDAEYISRILRNTRKVKFVKLARVFYRVEGKSTLSGFNTYENALSAVKSLRYLEYNLSDYPKIKARYVGNLKANISKRIKASYPILYEQNADLWINN